MEKLAKSRFGLKMVSDSIKERAMNNTDTAQSWQRIHGQFHPKTKEGAAERRAHAAGLATGQSERNWDEERRLSLENDCACPEEKREAIKKALDELLAIGVVAVVWDPDVDNLYFGNPYTKTLIVEGKVCAGPDLVMPDSGQSVASIMRVSIGVQFPDELTESDDD